MRQQSNSRTLKMSQTQNVTNNERSESIESYLMSSSRLGQKKVFRPTKQDETPKQSNFPKCNRSKNLSQEKKSGRLKKYKNAKGNQKIKGGNILDVLTQRQVEVLFAMVYFCNWRDLTCWAAQQTISKKSKVPIRTVEAAIARFVELELGTYQRLQDRDWEKHFYLSLC